MKVNAMIIGAGRAGTTSVYAYLSAHPEVCFSITKEVHFFSVDDLYRRGEKYFHSLFEHPDKKLIVSADTYLLIDKNAPQRIAEYNPEMKLIVMLRDPVERAYSNYTYSVSFGHEDASVSFMQTIETEKEVIASGDIVEQNNRAHFYGSLYYRHISYWKQFFPRANFILLRLQDLKNDPQSFYQDLCTQLGIHYFPFEHSGEKFNKASGVKSKRLQQFLLNRNSALRKTLSFILRPFRNIIIKSGIIDKVYKMNKKEIDFAPLGETEKKDARKYFTADLQLLEKEWDVRLEE